MAHPSEFDNLLEILGAENLPHLQGMGRRERRASETRLRLFRCALQLFAQHGFPYVTVDDITVAADVGKGTFFNYFEREDHALESGGPASTVWAGRRRTGPQSGTRARPAVFVSGERSHSRVAGSQDD